MTTATTTNPTTTTATYKKLNALSDPEACSNFLMNIKNKLRGARVIETIDGVKTDRGNLTRLLNSRVYPVAGGRERLGVEDITAPANPRSGTDIEPLDSLDFCVKCLDSWVLCLDFA